MDPRTHVQSDAAEFEILFEKMRDGSRRELVKPLRTIGLQSEPIRRLAKSLEPSEKRLTATYLSL